MVPSHFSVQPANMCTRAVQGRRRYARARRRSRIPTASRPLPTFSGGGSWAEPLLQTAHRRIPPPARGQALRKESRLEASPSGFRPRPLVPGLFSFRARVILLTADLTPRSEMPLSWRSKLPTETLGTLHPPRPTQRLPVRGKVPPFPHPEPPLLFFASGRTPLLRSPTPACPPIPTTIANAQRSA
jgi:hypothetical protein